MARKKKKLTKAQRAKISRRNLKKAQAALRKKHGHKKGKKKTKAKKGHKKAKRSKAKHGHRKVGFSNYKAVAARKAQLAAVKAKLEAKGMPPHLVKKVLARVARATGGGKTKSTGWFAKQRAKEAAERAAAYIEKSYATPISYV